MASVVVVLASPDFQQCLGLGDAAEDRLRQDFVSQSAVEALGIGVLPGRSRVDVARLRLNRVQVCLDAVCDELGTVVAPDTCWRATFLNQMIKNLNQVPARQ